MASSTTAIRPDATTQNPKDYNPKKIIALISFGCTLEFFEFSSFLLFSGYLSGVFFPESDSSDSLFLTFALFSSAYFARPIGGMVLGSLADKKGRSQVFLITVVIMATATFCIGAFPNSLINTPYCLWLLACLRIFQGIAFGADIPITTAFIAEHAGKHRGLAAGILYSAIFMGGMGGAIIGYGLTSHLTDHDIIAWGWRIPFLIGSTLGIVSFILRKKLVESPLFLRSLERKELQKQPLKYVFKTQKIQIITVLLLIASPAIVHTMIYALPSYTDTRGTNNFLFLIYATILPMILSPLRVDIKPQQLVNRRAEFILNSQTIV